MTTPAITPVTSSAPSFPLRVAATLSMIVGVLSVGGALAVSLPALNGSATSGLALIVNMSAALLMCAAAVLIWKRRRFGVFAIGVAWALPNVLSLILGQSLRPPSLLMLLAILTVASNWRELGRPSTPLPNER